MFIYNCIVNETAAFEWFWGDFLQLILKYKKMHNTYVSQHFWVFLIDRKQRFIYNRCDSLGC